MKLLKLFLFFFLSLIIIHRADGQTRISPGKAKNNIGKEVIIHGKVEQVYKSAVGNYFLNMGGKFPNNKFTAVIFRSGSKKFGKPEVFEGKEVDIYGKIREYNGKPEIILDSLEQIRIIDKKSVND